MEGGGSPTAPTFSASLYGVSTPKVLTTTPTDYWFDDESAWNIANVLGESGSNERWQTNQPSTGTLSASSTLVFIYYHQYQVNAKYSTWGDITPTQKVVLAGSQFGSNSYTLNLTTAYQMLWLDANTLWSVNQIPASPTTERWAADVSSGSVTSSIAINPTYFHQYLLTVAANQTGVTGATFDLTYTQFGITYVNQLQNVPWSTWTNAGSAASVTNPEASRNGYTFSGYVNNPATMNSAQTITLLYKIKTS